MLDGEEIRVDVVPAVLNIFCAYDERAQRSSANVWDDIRLSPPFV